MDAPDFVVGQDVLDGLEGLPPVGVRAERFPDFLQDAPTEARGQIQVEAVEWSVFVEIRPGLMRGVVKPVKVCRCPVGAHDGVGNAAGDIGEPCVSIGVSVWQANREAQVRGCHWGCPRAGDVYIRAIHGESKMAGRSEYQPNRY